MIRTLVCSAVLPAAILLASCAREKPVPERAGQAEQQRTAAKSDGPSPYDAAFWQTWGDGNAEVAAYDLTMPRYNQSRSGTAILITVSEPFSYSARVKADPGKHSDADVFPAMKLNLLREYQTGVYNYRDMLSTFVALKQLNTRAPGTATKITYSSQEWCGHVWSQLLFNPKQVQQIHHSYFDGEGDSQRTLDSPDLAISADTLPLVARRIAWPRLRLGQTYSVPLLTSLETERAKHVPLKYQNAVLSLSADRQSTVVPAGTFRTHTFMVKEEGGMTRTYAVEADPPHRIIRWETSEGEKGELLGSDRMKYWQMNQEGGEKALESLGLTRRGPRMP